MTHIDLTYYIKNNKINPEINEKKLGNNIKSYFSWTSVATHDIPHN